MSVLKAIEHGSRKGFFGEAPFSGDKTPRAPDLGTIGFIVANDRGFKQLSAQALAAMANVSISSIERIERCESVSDDVLRKVAVALGREEGAFVDKRVPLDPDQALELLEESVASFEGTVPVAVLPLRKQGQVRAIADAAALLVDGGRLDERSGDDIAALREWFGFCSFLRAEKAGLIVGGEQPKMRKTYGDVLRAVRDLERSARAVALAGTYSATVGAGRAFAGATVTA